MDNFKDIEFEDVDNETKDKQIRGTALYYNTSQVASILNIPDSTVRYYTKVFDDILKVEIINKQRKYKQSDIDKLKFICELKDEGMSIKQIQEYCSEVSFEEGKGVQIKESNPLSIQTLAKALMEHQEEQIQAMEERIVNRLEEYMINQSEANIGAIEKIKEELSITVDDAVSEKIEEIKEYSRDTRSELDSINNKLEKVISYVSVDEIEKQRQKAPNRFWKWFTGTK